MSFLSQSVRTVFRKEMRETFRDRRVIISVIVSPLVITPLLILIMGLFIGHKVSSEQTEQLTVGIVSTAGSLPELNSAIKNDKTLKLIDFPNRPAAEDAIRNRHARAVVIVPSNAAQEISSGKNISLELLFDSSDEKSRTAHGRLADLVRTLREKIVGHRLAARSLSGDFIKPVEIKSTNLASKTSVGGSILGTFLPYIVILSASFGGMAAAFDLCAGEKERGTMETLLVSPVSRREIILGKLLTIGAISALAAICSVAGLVGAIQGGLQLAHGAFNGKIAIDYTSVAVLLLILIPLSLMTSALLLMVSTIARNPKEAQAYVFPFMILIILPAMSSSVMGPENSLFLSVVPVLNTALVMKQVLNSLFNWPFMILSMVSSLLYAGLAMRAVIGLFNREAVLFRT